MTLYGVCAPGVRGTALESGIPVAAPAVRARFARCPGSMDCSMQPPVIEAVPALDRRVACRLLARSAMCGPGESLDAVRGLPSRRSGEWHSDPAV